MNEDQNKPSSDPASPPTPPEPVNNMPENMEVFEPNQPAVSNINQRQDDQFVAKDIGFSSSTPDKAMTNSRYEGPVTQSGVETGEYAQSYNSTTQPVKKSHARQYKMLALIVLIALLLGVGALIFFTGEKDSSGNNAVATDVANEVSEEQETEDLPAVEEQEDEATDETQVDEPVVEATPEQADNERKSDINAIYQSLETYFADNGFYPTEKFSETLLTGVTADNLVDAESISVSQQIQLGTTTPTTPYTAEKPEGSQYRYVAYKCTSSVPGESKCNSFMLFSWLESDPAGYSKASLN